MVANWCMARSLKARYTFAEFYIYLYITYIWKICILLTPQFCRQQNRGCIFKLMGLIKEYGAHGAHLGPTGPRWAHVSPMKFAICYNKLCCYMMRSIRHPEGKQRLQGWPDRRSPALCSSLDCKNTKCDWYLPVVLPSFNSSSSWFWKLVIHVCWMWHNRGDSFVTSRQCCLVQCFVSNDSPFRADVANVCKHLIRKTLSRASYGPHYWLELPNHGIKSNICRLCRSSSISS